MAAAAGGAKPAKEKREIDWASIEVHYRAGVRSLKNIGEEFGVSDAAIIKRAKRDDWTRDLKAKIDAKAAEKVSVAAVSAEVSAQTKLTERVIVEANANLVASAELVQRSDILNGLQLSRDLMAEVAALSRPDLAKVLQDIGDACDDSYFNDQGRLVRDKVNDLYLHIISLASRVKSAKEIAATHGVYIPLQRKVLRMEEDADKGANEIDQLLLGVLQSQ